MARGRLERHLIEKSKQRNINHGPHGREGNFRAKKKKKREMKRPPGRKEEETRAQREKYTQGGREENESERIAIHKTVGPHWPGSNISSVVTSKTSLTHKKEAKGRTNNLTGQVETANCSLGLGGPHPSPLLLRFCVYRVPYKKKVFSSLSASIFATLDSFLVVSSSWDP